MENLRLRLLLLLDYCCPVIPGLNEKIVTRWLCQSYISPPSEGLEKTVSLIQ